MTMPIRARLSKNLVASYGSVRAVYANTKLLTGVKINRIAGDAPLISM